MTYAELVTLINTNLTRVGNNRVSAAEIKQVCQSLLDFAAAIDNSDAIPDWTGVQTFQTDGSGAGKYCKHPDLNGKLRIFETKIDNNINFEPPTDPNTTEDANWVEISASAGSGVQEWAPGLYGAGLVIVYHNHSVDGSGFYKLDDPVRPFNSADIEAEITSAKWTKIGGSGKGIAKTYATIAALLADQANQQTDFFYFVTDASTDATVDAGWAIYQKLAASTGAIGDYQKLSEQESLDVIFNVADATESVKGIAELASQAESETVSDGTLANRNHDRILTARGFRWAWDKMLATASLITATLNSLGVNLDLIVSNIVAGTLSLDLNNRRENCFVINATVSTNFAISLSNLTNARIITIDLKITGTVAITLPSSFRMDSMEEIRWNSSTKVLTLTGTTDSPFELSATFNGTIWKLKASGIYS